MKFKRNKNQGFTEVYKDGELFGLSFSIEDLWKRKVYVTYSKIEKKQSDNQRKKSVS